MEPETIEFRAPFDEGDVLISMPKTMGKASVGEFRQWIAWIVSRLENRAGISKPEPKPKAKPAFDHDALLESAGGWPDGEDVKPAPSGGSGDETLWKFVRK